MDEQIILLLKTLTNEASCFCRLEWSDETFNLIRFHLAMMMMMMMMIGTTKMMYLLLFRFIKKIVKICTSFLN